MVNKNLQKNDANEKLSASDVQIRQMIKNMPRVDAPKDFDFRLKARITNAKSTNSQPWFLPVFRYVLPLSVIVLIFTLIIINGVYFAENNQTVAEIQPVPVQNLSAPANESNNTLPETTNIPVEAAADLDLADSVQPRIEAKKNETTPLGEVDFIAVKAPKEVRAELQEIKNPDEGGGSLDSSYKETEVITPRGIPSNDLVEVSPNNENKNDIITKQILLPLGIEIVSENGKRRVKSVKKESVAERSGVKVGDLVEMIDGEKVSGDSVRGKKLEGKQITVVRGAETRDIDFINQ